MPPNNLLASTRVLNLAKWHSEDVHWWQAQTNQMWPQQSNPKTSIWGPCSHGVKCGGVKSLIYLTFSLTSLFFLPEFVMTLTHNGLFATFLNSGEVCFLQRNRPICPNLLFPVFSQNKPSNGNTLLYNHVLASQGLHLHNWGTAYWTSKLCAVTLAEEWDDSHWIIFFMGLFFKHI